MRRVPLIMIVTAGTGTAQSALTVRVGTIYGNAERGISASNKNVGRAHAVPSIDPARP